MTLSEFIKKHKLTVEDFALSAGLSADAVYKYLRGDRMPRWESLSKIGIATTGKVTANDFMPANINKKSKPKR